ncbi:hypothetical protein [Bhargavaea cecembensis]|uniref:hypothetical protein n=1 Tax=Bhargavaea cecembensis TaxID=394098 RepID=UPI000590D9D7|nr:hypothetical protein [Bhargavaea cecembensis]
MLKIEVKKRSGGRGKDSPPDKEFSLEISTAFLCILLVPVILLARSRSRSPFMTNTNHTYNIQPRREVN